MIKIELVRDIWFEIDPATARYDLFLFDPNTQWIHCWNLTRDQLAQKLEIAHAAMNGAVTENSAASLASSPDTPR